MYFQRPVELNIDIELNSEQWGRGGTERMGKGRGGSAAGMRGNSFFHLALLLPNVCLLFCEIYVSPSLTTLWILRRDAKAQKKAGKKFFESYPFFAVFFF